MAHAAHHPACLRYQTLALWQTAQHPDWPGTYSHGYPGLALSGDTHPWFCAAWIDSSCCI
jgi:hypothetical protein